MHLQVVNEYPSDAAFGVDYFSGAARGKLMEEGPDGMLERDEKVIVTDRYLDYEGQVCVGERTVRHLAHEFGMVDGWKVDRVIADNGSLRSELVELSEEVARVRAQLAFAQELERAPAVTKFVGLDGHEHASQRAAAEASAKLLGYEPGILTEAIPTPLKEPV